MFNNVEYSTRTHIANFMYAVYAWVAVGLGLASITAYTVASSPSISLFFRSNPFIFLVIVIGQFSVIISLSTLLQRMSFPAAMGLFLLLTASYGFTLSNVFYIYTESSIITTFIVSALTFTLMAIYGYLTRADLTSVGSMGMMILCGMAVAMLVNIFVRNETFDIIISGFGVIIFTLFIAYDSQKIKRIGEEHLYHNETLNKVALLGAVILFLDFINLFLFLLRFLGYRKDR